MDTMTLGVRVWVQELRALLASQPIRVFEGNSGHASYYAYTEIHGTQHDDPTHLPPAIALNL